MTEGALILIYGVVGPILLFSSVFLLFWFRAGSHTLNEMEARLESLEARLTPRISVTLPATNPFHLWQGSTTETMTGCRQTVITHQTDIVCLHFRNESADCVDFGTAKLIGAWKRKTNDGPFEDMGLIESITLNWCRDINRPEEHAHFDAGETKRLYIAALHPNGMMHVFVKPENLPLEYQLLFGDIGNYRLCIQVQARDCPTRRILMEIVTTAPEPGAPPTDIINIAILNPDVPPELPPSPEPEIRT